MSRVVLAVSILTLTQLPRLGWADDPERQLPEARAHWLRGHYEEAIEIYSRLAGNPQTREAAAIGLSRCYVATGDLDRASSAIDKAVDELPDAPDLRARRAELALSRGNLDLARNDCVRVLQNNPDHLLARWVQVQLDFATGDTSAALRGCEWFVQLSNRSKLTDPDSLVLVGQAAVVHAMYRLRGREQSQQLNRVLNDIYDEAVQRDPDYWPALYWSGRLFLDKHRKADAVNDFRRALKINPNAADLHAALGLAALDDYDIETAQTHADRALGICANLPSAQRLKADLFIAREQYIEALQQLHEACRVNPVDEENLGRLAACYALRGNRGELDGLRDQVISRNPRPVLFYLRLAERLEDHRRFDVAERYFEQAIAADPDRSEARTGLGMLYMRVGKEAEAATTLDQAFDMDPFNARTKNMLEVLEQLAGYKTIETQHFRIKFDEELDGVLGRYVAKYLEEVYGELTARFGYSPEERIQIEIFNKGRGESAHRWFSARTVGLPWIGTVGACTGKVVALTSPHGVEKPFNWARVLKHEVSHVITLQQTNFNIPHWYTEALAVQVEGYPRPQVWNQLLAERVPAGNLLNLDNINLAFARPKSALDWQMAYCQSELYAEFMQQRFGASSVSRLLDAYRDGRTTEEAIEQAFMTSLPDFEAGYLQFLGEVARGLHSAPVEPPMTRVELEQAVVAQPNNPDLAARLAAEFLKTRTYAKARELAIRATELKPNHPNGNFILARLQLLAGDAAKARELLEAALDRKHPDPRVLELLANLLVQAKQFDRAQSLYQLGRDRYPTESKWIAGVARVALITDNRSALRAALEQLSLVDPDDPSPRKKLAAMALEVGDAPNAVRFAWMVLHINVADPDAHRILGDGLWEQKSWSNAADEYRMVVQLRPADLGAWIKLARSLREAGDRDGAIAALNELLEKHPENAEGRELLAELKR